MMDFEITVKMKVENLCNEEDLVERTPYDILKDITNDFSDSISAYTTPDYEVTSIERICPVVESMECSNKLILNRAKCLNCRDIIISYFRHDFNTCSCGQVSVDGGLDYAKRSGTDYQEMSIWSNAPFELVRQYLHRGTYNPEGDTIYVPLNAMTDKHVISCISYNEQRGLVNNYVTEYYRKEIEYRKTNNIEIEEKECK